MPGVSLPPPSGRVSTPSAFHAAEREESKRMHRVMSGISYQRLLFTHFIQSFSVSSRKWLEVGRLHWMTAFSVSQRNLMGLSKTHPRPLALLLSAWQEWLVVVMGILTTPMEELTRITATVMIRTLLTLQPLTRQIKAGEPMPRMKSEPFLESGPLTSHRFTLILHTSKCVQKHSEPPIQPFASWATKQSSDSD